MRELGLEKRTLIMFTSDNGAHAGYGTNLEFFQGNGDLRGTKGTWKSDGEGCTFQRLPVYDAVVVLAERATIGPLLPRD